MPRRALFTGFEAQTGGAKIPVVVLGHAFTAVVAMTRRTPDNGFPSGMIEALLAREIAHGCFRGARNWLNAKIKPGMATPISPMTSAIARGRTWGDWYTLS